MDFHQKSRILGKNALEFNFFSKMRPFLTKTMLVASQFEVAELIPATFEVPRGILDALEQFLSIKGPQSAIVGGLGVDFYQKITYFR